MTFNKKNKRDKKRTGTGGSNQNLQPGPFSPHQLNQRVKHILLLNYTLKKTIFY